MVRFQGDVMRNRQKGFSLIELLIVVAIILIIAAIAIPNLLRSKIAANQASAVGSLRTLNTACIAFSTSYGQFPAALSNLGPLGGTVTTASSTSADLIDSVLASGQKSGYTFTFNPGGSNQSYSITASPITPATTGQNMYYTDQSGVIRQDTSGSGAGPTSTPIG
jgi:type IV pilus assembly protein PilA